MVGILFSHTILQKRSTDTSTGPDISVSVRNINVDCHTYLALQHRHWFSHHNPEDYIDDSMLCSIMYVLTSMKEALM